MDENNHNIVLITQEPLGLHKFIMLYFSSLGNLLSDEYRDVSNKRSPSNKRPPYLFSNKTR